MVENKTLPQVDRPDDLEEVFKRVMQRLMKGTCLLPSELWAIDPPRNLVWHTLLHEKPIPEALKYVTLFMEEGFIEKTFKKKEVPLCNDAVKEVIMGVKIARDKLPREIPQEVLEERVSLFYSAFEIYLEAKIGPGTRVSSTDPRFNADYLYLHILNELYGLANLETPPSKDSNNETEFEPYSLYQNIKNILEKLGILEIHISEDFDGEGASTSKNEEIVFRLSKEEALSRIRNHYKKHGPVIDDNL